MACFLISAGEAVVVTAVQLTVKALEKKGVIKYEPDTDGTKKAKWSKKLGILNGMLWGGSGLLALEHIFHGEVSSCFPFLTAMSSAEDTSAMLHEMLTAGVAMAGALTLVWGIGVFLYYLLAEKKASKKKSAKCIEG